MSNKTRLELWEDRLEPVLDRVDHYLEETYGGDYPLHPARSRRGTTASPEHEGLFSVLANYTLGVGSEEGEGYVLEVRMVTLANVPADVRETIEDEAVERIQEELDKEFPDDSLNVVRDGQTYKIVGDLNL